MTSGELCISVFTNRKNDEEASEIAEPTRRTSMSVEECSCKGTSCDRLVRTLLGINIRCCLFAVILLSLVLFASVSIYMTAGGHRGSQEDLEALHVNANVMAVMFNQSNVPPTERKKMEMMFHLINNDEGRGMLVHNFVLYTSPFVSL